MEQQVEALPADVESILQPISADHTQAQPTPEAQPVVAQPAPQPVAPAPPAEPQVPLHVLLDERKERQAYQRQIQQFIEAQQRASQPQPQPIDPVAEPERAFQAIQQAIIDRDRQTQEMAVHQRANTSEMLARRDHGDQVVDQAVEAAKQAGVNRNFMMKPDPYKELMAWHNAQTIAQQVGPDLKSWEAKKEQEIEARVMARLGIKPTQPQTNGAAPQVLPPSLSGATRANTASPVIQDASDFFRNSLFAKPQRT